MNDSGGNMQTRRLAVTGGLSLVALSLAALSLAALSEGGGKEPPAPPPPQAVTVAEVPEREVTEWDEFTGRLEAVDQVEIRPRVSGYIKRVTFAEGKEVSEGRGSVRDRSSSLPGRSGPGRGGAGAGPLGRVAGAERSAASRQAGGGAGDLAGGVRQPDQRGGSRAERRYAPQRPRCRPPG